MVALLLPADLTNITVSSPSPELSPAGIGPGGADGSDVGSANRGLRRGRAMRHVTGETYDGAAGTTLPGAHRLRIHRAHSDRRIGDRLASPAYCHGASTPSVASTESLPEPAAFSGTRVGFSGHKTPTNLYFHHASGAGRLTTTATDSSQRWIARRAPLGKAANRMAKDQYDHT